MSENRQTCFVIMPFSQTTDEHTEEYWKEHFENFLKPLIEENLDFEARRSEALRGDILKQIITDLVVSPVVVSNLTDNNTNVYWELGVRQSFKHGTITIAEEGIKLPFDIGGKGTLFYYPKNHLKMKGFVKQFKEAIQDCCSHPDRPDSHVLETISGRGTLFEIFRRDEAIRRLDAVLSECNKNLLILKAIAYRVRLNQQDIKNYKVPADRFRIIAIELLITNRYVDEEWAFFELAERCWNQLYGINEQLNTWRISSDSTEKFILKTNEETKNIIEGFKAKVEVARDKLSKQF
ncbi:MAG: hypothetical protein PHU34_01550 [Candidatus Methanoperedens sp.]|nr:hypothetical protein [Candidatus Methanoperedens sp.]